MFLILPRPPGPSVPPRRRYWRTALAGTVTVTAALLAFASAASAASAATPGRAATAARVQTADRAPAHASGLGNYDGILAGPWEKRCGPNFLKFYRVNPGTNVCYGGIGGPIGVNLPGTYEFCAGNNSGYYWYDTAQGLGPFEQKFVPGFLEGYSAANPVKIVLLEITGFSGSFTCPT